MISGLLLCRNQRFSVKQLGLIILTILFFFNGNTPVNELELREQVVVSAAKMLGTPYRRGGKSENGYDCSGFVQSVLSQNNIKVSRSSCTQVYDGVEVPLESVRPGDILIFSGSKKSKHPGHAALVHHVDENGTVYFIHSASGSGITIDNMNQDYYKKRFIKARDVISLALIGQETETNIEEK